MGIKTEKETMEEVVQGRAFYLSAQPGMRFVMEECIFSLAGAQRVVLIRLALPFPFDGLVFSIVHVSIHPVEWTFTAVLMFLLLSFAW